MKNAVYLDHNATTPIRPEVLDEMLPFLKEHYGNPSSAHTLGRFTREALEISRQKLILAVGAIDAKEIIFTSGATEADNMALLGAANLPIAEKRRKIVTSAIEHPAIYEPAKYLAKKGFEVVFLPVDKYGVVDLSAAEREIDENTLIVSVMVANNEIGTIQPIKQISALAKKHGALMHADAVQALGKIPVNVKELGVDMASFASHKIYGPKGVGALYVKKGVKIEPTLRGGHQERLVRPGTENLAGIVGFGKAAEMAAEDVESGKNERIREMRDRLQGLLLEKIPHCRLNGAPEGRVPNTLNISFMFVEGEGMTLALDAMGIAISTGSACSSGTLDPSHVLLAIGVPVDVAHGSLRFSLGFANTMEDMDYTAACVAKVVGRLRDMSPLWEDFISGKTTTYTDKHGHSHDLGDAE